MFLGIILVRIAICRLVAAIGQPAADCIPGLAKLVGFDFKTAHRIGATGNMHLSKFAFRFGIFIFNPTAMWG